VRNTECGYEKDGNKGMLSEEQKKFYKENGYLVLRGLFPRDEAEDLRRELLQTVSKPWVGSKRSMISSSVLVKTSGADVLMPFAFIVGLLIRAKWPR